MVCYFDYASFPLYVLFKLSAGKKHIKHTTVRNKMKFHTSIIRIVTFNVTYYYLTSHCTWKEKMKQTSVKKIILASLLSYESKKTFRVWNTFGVNLIIVKTKKALLEIKR